MQIFYSIDQQITNQPTVLTIGKFDGFHIGHQQLIRTAVERAKHNGHISAVLTFEPHPSQVIYPERELRMLTCLEERIELFESFKLDLLVIAPFNRAVMNTRAYDYMVLIKDAMPLSEVWVGANFALGYKREGTIPRLIEIGKQLYYTVGSIAPMVIGGASVSSSRVRQLLSDGIVEGVQDLLGRPYALDGEVVPGNQRGHTLGFPTANVDADPCRMFPANGVYAGYAYVKGEKYHAVVNVGIRPTFEDAVQTIEAHLLDWSGDLYGEMMRVEFLHHLRGERKFAQLEELAAQIRRDSARARELLHK